MCGASFTLSRCALSLPSRSQRNLDHGGSPTLVAPLRGWRLGHRQTHLLPVNARTSQKAEGCHHVHDGSRERRQTAIPGRRNRERKRAPEPIFLPETDALRPLPKLQLAPPDQSQVQHCGCLVQQSRIDQDGCHTEGRGVQEGHTGAPREWLLFSIRCWSPRSRKKSEATSTESDLLAQTAGKISTVVMPFVDDVTQPLQWVLKPLNIRVVGKPATWKWCLQHLLLEPRWRTRCGLPVDLQRLRSDVHRRNRAHSDRTRQGACVVR